MRSLNLVPFAAFSRGEVLSNFIVFIPFGLLLGVNLKRVSMGRKLAFIFIFSLAAEMIQYILAIGTTDITDVIINTLGGLLGLMLYSLGNRYVDNEKQDRIIVGLGIVLLVLFLLFRFLILRVRY